MNVTEKVIVEQFGFWEKALSLPLPTLSGSTYVITGCGTSFYLAQIVASAFNLNGKTAIAVPGGEWARRRDAYLADQRNLCVIALSRSGESTETVQAVEVSRKAGMKTIGIVCEKESSLARAAETVIYAETHKSEGIVMTVSASLMLLVGLRLAGAEVSPAVVQAAKDNFERMAAALPAIIKGRSHFVYLGAGALYGMASEGALKLQEMSLSYSQAFHPMEYRHGPISLVDSKTFTVLLYSPDTAAEEAKVASEIQAKGSYLVGFGGPGDLSLPVTLEGPQRALVVLPALQILGERVAEERGMDTVAPRHLNKVVVLS
ncbi:MAG TPA: SIS domain-containing protein [Terriglobales bacterium]|nr:SIS domain-containing protein [Terriglobales bacterium]